MASCGFQLPTLGLDSSMDGEMIWFPSESFLDRWLGKVGKSSDISVHWCFISLAPVTVAPPYWLEPLKGGRTLVLHTLKVLHCILISIKKKPFKTNKKKDIKSESWLYNVSHTFLCKQFKNKWNWFSIWHNSSGTIHLECALLCQTFW